MYCSAVVVVVVVEASCPINRGARLRGNECASLPAVLYDYPFYDDRRHRVPTKKVNWIQHTYSDDMGDHSRHHDIKLLYPHGIPCLPWVAPRGFLIGPKGTVESVHDGYAVTTHMHIN